jgi:hypothetical protein
LVPREGARLPFEIGLDAALLAPPRAPGGGAFETLAEEVHVEVQPDGGATRYQQRLVRVRRVPEDRASRTAFVRFDPSQESVRVLTARVHRGGLAVEVLARELVQVSEAWYGLYYDQRELGVPFDDLQPGDVIQIAHRRDTIGPRPLPGTWDLIEILQERSHKHRMAASVVAPTAMKLRAALVVPPAATDAGMTVQSGREALAGGRERLWIDARGVPPLAAERLMPGAAEVAALWQLTTFAGWQDVATRYRSLVDPQRVVTPAMRRWVAAKQAAVAVAPGRPGLTGLTGGAALAGRPGLTGGAPLAGGVGRAGRPQRPDRDALVRAIVEAVARDIRYVGLEFGIHGYKPYRTDQVWARRFGDCKDQATLLTTLLRVAGVDAHVALLRTRKQGRLPQALPSLALFDHAVVWLADQDLYVDPTERTFGLGQLPPPDQGAQVLILDPQVGHTLRQTPVDRPGASAVEGRYEVTLQRSGRARVAGIVTFRGTAAPPYRDRLADEDARESRVEKLLNGRYPGLELLDFDVSDPTALAQPLVLRFTGEAPSVAGDEGGRLQIARAAGGEGLASRWASDSARVQPLAIGPPVSQRFDFRYRLPEGFAVGALPPSARGAGPFGGFSVAWRREPGLVVVETELTLAVDQIAAADYPAFRDFMQRFDQAVQHPLVLDPLAPTAAMPTGGRP